MKTITVILTTAVFLALLPALSGIVTAQPLINSAGGGCNASMHPFVLAQSDSGPNFDLNHCQWECRMRYGLEPTGPGGGGGGGGMNSIIDDGNGAYELHQSSATYNQYAACLADCTRQFWTDFDKKTGEIKKTPSTRP